MHTLPLRSPTPVVTMQLVEQQTEFLLVTRMGRLLRTSLASLPPATNGATLTTEVIQLRQNDAVVGVLLLP